MYHNKKVPPYKSTEFLKREKIHTFRGKRAINIKSSNVSFKIICMKEIKFYFLKNNFNSRLFKCLKSFVRIVRYMAFDIGFPENVTGLNGIVVILG